MSESTTSFLNRWLDRTPLKQLARTRNFITIPPFNIPSVWLGYSDIVGIYDYVVGNNFTFKGVGKQYDGGNYTLVVSYVNPDLSVVRYRLVKGNGEIIFQDIPQYNGQSIKKRFRIEIWSTPNQVASQSTALTLRTGVLNNVDVRYGSDTELDTVLPTLTTAFSAVIDSGTPSGAPSLNGLVMRFEPLGIVDSTPPTIDTWTDSVGGLVLTPVSGAPTLRTFGFVSGAQCLGNAKLQGTGAIINPMPHIYVAFFGAITQQNANDIVWFSLGGAAPQIQLNAAAPAAGQNKNKEVKTLGGTFDFTANGAAFIELNLVSGVVNVFDWATGTILATGTLGPSASKISRVTVGDAAGLAGAGNIICKVLGYNAIQSPADRTQTLQYLVGTPIDFPYQPIANTY